MSAPIAFTVFGKPAPAGSKRGFVRGGHVIITDASAGSRPWKAQVADKAGEIMGDQPMLEGPIVARFTFYLTRPKGHSGRKGLLPSAPLFPTVKPDLLKLARGVEDALTSICYRDDSQIVVELLLKRYGEPARVEISLHPFDGVSCRDDAVLSATLPPGVPSEGDV